MVNGYLFRILKEASNPLAPRNMGAKKDHNFPGFTGKTGGVRHVFLSVYFKWYFILAKERRPLFMETWKYVFLGRNLVVKLVNITRNTEF